jgi:hypothetical protein
LHRPQHHRGDQHEQQAVQPQRLQQQLARQRMTQLKGLGHLDGGHALASTARHGLQQHGHAHGLATVALVVEAHQRGVNWWRVAVRV